MAVTASWRIVEEHFPSILSYDVYFLLPRSLIGILTSENISNLHGRKRYPMAKRVDVPDNTFIYLFLEAAGMFHGQQNFTDRAQSFLYFFLKLNLRY